MTNHGFRSQPPKIDAKKPYLEEASSKLTTNFFELGFVIIVNHRIYPSSPGVAIL